MTGYKLTPEQEQRFDEWNWRSDSSFGKIKSSTDIRELKILLAQEIQRAVEAERERIKRCCFPVRCGSCGQEWLDDNHACEQRSKALTKTETTEETA